MLKKGFSKEWNHFVYRCPEQDCYLALEVKEIGLIPPHTCPQINGKTRITFPVDGPTLVEQMWQELDSVTKNLMEKTGDEHSVGYAKGLAWTVSLFMTQLYPTPKDVSREAVVRYKARQAGESYQSAGLGHRRHEWKIYAESSHAKHEASKSEKQTVPKKQNGFKQLTDTETAGIKAAVEMFTPDQLANVYKIPIEQVKQILAQA